MGFWTRLLTFPISGPLWVMEQVVAEAERQLYDEDAIRGQLAELEMRYEYGEIDDEQLERAEDELIERLRVARARRQWEG
jgi:hypothetical protein